MSALLTTRSIPVGLAVVVLLAGCAGSAGPTATQIAASPRGAPAGGHVIHLNLAVPLASAAAIGSACDAADLRATGPKAATIPGSRLQLFDFDQASEAMTPLGDGPVPPTGAVGKPISDDPSFPSACVFSFDVPTTADVHKAYVFALGSIYIPVPIIPRADLEAAGWVADISVNPQ